MAEFLQDALLSKVGQSTAGGANKQTILDQMTPQQMQQLALGLLQIAQQQQSDGPSQQQQIPSLPTPGLQPPPMGRTDHSLGSIGSKSSVETHSFGESGSSMTQLKAQVSDWLEHFFPVQQEGGESKASEGGDEKLPPPPALEKSVSEALLSLSTGPTKFLSGISSILNEKANAGRELSTDSAAAPQPKLKPGPSTASFETSDSTTTAASGNGRNVPEKGELMNKTSTTLPRRGTKTIPPSKMLKLQPRSNATRAQKPLLPLRPRPDSTPATIKRQLLPLKPRPSKVIQDVLSSKQLSAPNKRTKKSIQEEMTDILRRPSSASTFKPLPTAAPGVPPMLQLARSDSIRPPSLPLEPSMSTEKGNASTEKDSETER
jgi:hypothetical protein